MDRYLGQDEGFQFWKIHSLYTDKQLMHSNIFFNAMLL